jgi:hypothetical protein
MDRRTFIVSIVGGLIAAPAVSQTRKVATVGWVGG